MNSTTAATPEQRERVRRALDGELDPSELDLAEQQLYDDRIERLIAWDEAEREKEVTSAWRAAATVAATAPEQRAILDAGQRLETLDQLLLHTYAHDDQPIGPRLGIENVPEPTLKACAFGVLEKRERRRDTWKWGIGIAVAVALAAGGWTVAALKLHPTLNPPPAPDTHSPARSSAAGRLAVPRASNPPSASPTNPHATY